MPGFIQGLYCLLSSQYLISTFIIFLGAKDPSEKPKLALSSTHMNLVLIPTANYLILVSKQRDRSLLIFFQMPISSSQRYFHLEGQRERTVLQQNNSINVVHGYFSKILSAVEQYRLSPLEGAVLTLTLSSQGKVGQPRVHIIRQQIDPVVTSMLSLLLETNLDAPAKSIVIVAMRTTVRNGGKCRLVCLRARDYVSQDCSYQDQGDHQYFVH